MFGTGNETRFNSSVLAGQGDPTPVTDQAQLYGQQVKEDTSALMDRAPIVNTQANQALTADKFGRVYRGQVSQAAARGLMHSGTLATIQAENARAQAMANVGLQAQEEATRRDRLMKVEEQLAKLKGLEPQLSKEADRPQNPASGDMMTNVLAEVGKARQQATIADTNKEVTGMIQELTKRRVSESDLNARFKAEIDRTFAQLEAAALRHAQAAGMSADQMRGLQGQMAIERQNAYNTAAGVAKDATGPDPALASQTLSALYNPDNLPTIYEQRKGTSGIPSTLGRIAGLWVGAYIGGQTGDVIGGMKTGYQVGGVAGDTIESGEMFG